MQNLQAKNTGKFKSQVNVMKTKNKRQMLLRIVKKIMGKIFCEDYFFISLSKLLNLKM